MISLSDREIFENDNLINMAINSFCTFASGLTLKEMDKLNSRLETRRTQEEDEQGEASAALTSRSTIIEIFADLRRKAFMDPNFEPDLINLVVEIQYALELSGETVDTNKISDPFGTVRKMIDKSLESARSTNRRE